MYIPWRCAQNSRKDGRRTSFSSTETPRTERSLSPRTARAKSFTRGDRVQARLGGRSLFVPGTILIDHGDGTFDVEYDEGERERRVDNSMILQLDEDGPKLSSRSRSGTESFREGMVVEARYRGGSKYYRGVVGANNGDGSYEIHYEDGEKESNVAESLIRPLERDGRGAKVSQARKELSGEEASGKAPLRRRRARRSMSETPLYEEGDKVEARYRGRSRYFAGQISRVNDDGTFDIDYDDGEKEERVATGLIREPASRARSRDEETTP
eukprot:scaffold4101_cov267-Pinguiococcus_pyrenoidosus.AAC.11